MQTQKGDVDYASGASDNFFSDITPSRTWKNTLLEIGTNSLFIIDL